MDGGGADAEGSVEREAEHGGQVALVINSLALAVLFFNGS